MNEFNVLYKGITNVPEGLVKIASYPFWGIIGGAIATFIALMFGDLTVAWAFAGLLVLDGVTGWLKARRNGSKPDSATLGYKTLTKMIVYLIPLIGWTLIEVVIEHCSLMPVGALNPVHMVIIGWICARELISVLENLNELYGDKYPIIGAIYKKIKGIEEQFASQFDSAKIAAGKNKTNNKVNNNK